MGDGVNVEPKMTSSDVLLEMLMLRLRTCDGVSLRFIADAFSPGIAEIVKTSLLRFVDDGLVSVGKPERCGQDVDSTFRLTDPKGFLCSNTVISDVFLAIDEEIGTL